MAAQSPVTATAPADPNATVKAHLALPSDVLRLGVRKHIIVPGTGPALSRPVAQCVVTYTLYTYDAAGAGARRKAQRDSDDTTPTSSSGEDESTAALLDSLGPGNFRLLEQQPAVAVTPGISSLVLGFEIGLLAMREGERALLQVPPDAAFPSSLRDRAVMSTMPLFYDVTVKSALAALQLPHGRTKFVQKEGNGAFPEVGDTVSVLIRSSHPITGTKLKLEKHTFALGTPASGVFDDAFLSMRPSEMAILFVDGLEYMIVLQTITASGFPAPVLQLRADAAPDAMGPVTPSVGPSPQPPQPEHTAEQRLRFLDIDPEFAATQLCSPLPPEERLAAVERLRRAGRDIMAMPTSFLKAVAIYHRAIAIIVAQPSLADHPSPAGDTARAELGLLYTNCGRAQLRADLPAAALVSAKAATVAAPDFGKGWFLYAQTLRRAGLLAESLEAFAACAPLEGVDAGEVAKEIALTQAKLAEEEAAAKALAEESAAAGSA